MYDYFYGASGNHFNFFQLPEDMVLGDEFRGMSSDAKLLYSVMLKRVGLSFKNGWIDENGRTYIIYTLEEAMKVFHCANQKATKLFNELETFGLIEKTRQGQGKPNLVYVKDFASRVDTVDNSSQTHEKSHAKTHENHDSGVMKIRIQDSWKSLGSNRDSSYISYSERDPILSGWDAEGMSEYDRYKEYFRTVLETDILTQDSPAEKETIDGILDLLAEVCSSNRQMIRVAGDDKPTEVVKSRFMKLNSSHIQYVLACLNENTTDIKNMKQYLLTALFNALVTISPYYQAKVNYDFSGRNPSFNQRDSAFEDYSYTGDDSF